MDYIYKYKWNIKGVYELYKYRWMEYMDGKCTIYVEYIQTLKILIINRSNIGINTNIQTLINIK